MVSSNSKPLAILFDWDNTLVDTWPVIHAALNATLGHMGHPEWTLDETRARVRLSMRDSFPKLFGDRWEEARDVFYASFEAAHLRALVEAPGAGDLLRGLRRLGIPSSIVSNKQGRFLRAEAAHLGWTEHFHALVGAGDAARDKPAPDPVTLALSGLEIVPGPESWFVGDSDVDMRIAHATGLLPVLIAPEHAVGSEFDEHPPSLRFDNLTALHEFLTA
jgi:phosphoglycolate phosphatase